MRSFAITAAFPTTVALCVPVTSPARLPVKLVVVPPLTAAATKAVVAIAVELFPAICVVAIVPLGNVGVPVSVGEADITNVVPVPV